MVTMFWNFRKKNGMICSTLLLFLHDIRWFGVQIAEVRCCTSYVYLIGNEKNLKLSSYFELDEHNLIIDSTLDQVLHKIKEEHCYLP